MVMPLALKYSCNFTFLLQTEVALRVDILECRVIPIESKLNHSLKAMFYHFCNRISSFYHFEGIGVEKTMPKCTCPPAVSIYDSSFLYKLPVGRNNYMITP